MSLKWSRWRCCSLSGSVWGIAMIENIIPLIGAFLPIWDNYLVYILALAFVGTVPCIIRTIIIRR